MSEKSIKEDKRKNNGRKPGQLKGTTYNVAPKKQITINFLEEDIQRIDEIAQAEGVTRSKVITSILNGYFSAESQAS